jgi:hypothetical protein
MKCPKCEHDIPDQLLAQYLGARGGSHTCAKYSKGEMSRRMREMVMKRWLRHNERKKLEKAD